MVKPLTFKGDKKPKKRKRENRDEAGANDDDGVSGVGGSSSRAAATKQKKAAGATTTTTTTTTGAGARGNGGDGDDSVENDDSWVSADVVSDVSGPVVLVLPTEDPVTALACDANGKVFALPVENLVDGNPATAEPHDVRMVWVANRIAGTENYRFKGHHGK